MKQIGNEKTMSVKEVAVIMKCSEDTIIRACNELFPEKIKNGIKTALSEMEITAIKLKVEKNYSLRYGAELPKTELEKEMLIHQAMIFQQEKISKLESQNQQLENRVSLLIHNGKTYTSTEIAKELGFKSAVQLNKILEEKGIQYKVNKTWVLSAIYSGEGFESIKQEELENGTIIYNRHWTGTGRDFILNILQLSNKEQEVNYI